MTVIYTKKQWARVAAGIAAGLVAVAVIVFLAVQNRPQAAPTSSEVNGVLFSNSLYTTADGGCATADGSLKSGGIATVRNGAGDTLGSGELKVSVSGASCMLSWSIPNLPASSSQQYSLVYGCVTVTFPGDARYVSATVGGCGETAADR